MSQVLEDTENMLQTYPTIILVSKSPCTWKGLLSVTNNHTNCKMNVAVKLVIPSYPSLDDASIYFGNSIAFLFGSHFKSQIDKLLKESEAVSAFFQELTVTIEKMIYDHQEKQTIGSLETEAREKLLRELDNVMSEYSDVEMSATKDLGAIKLSMYDISMIVQPSINLSGQNSWKIVNSELPDIPGSIDERKTYSLKEIRKMFRLQVNSLEEVWNQLRKIDTCCSVLDPVQPKPYHLYRRIYLSPSLSLLLMLSPMDPTGFPQVKFLGSEKEVEKYNDIFKDEAAAEEWDSDYSVYENLLTVLKIDDFPLPPKVEQFEQENMGMVSDEECCICFSKELDDGSVPEEICSNDKCRRRFHSMCLFQWLQQLPSNKNMFNKIFGPCPNCNQEISCQVMSN